MTSQRRNRKRRQVCPERREVLTLNDFTEEDIAAIAAARVPDEYAYLDEEVTDWEPE